MGGVPDVKKKKKKKKKNLCIDHYVLRKNFE